MNEYRFPYQTRRITGQTSQVTRQAASQPRPTSPSSNIHVPTETPAAAASRPDGDRVGRSDQDQVGRLNQGENATSGTLEGRTPVNSILIRIPYAQRTRSGRLSNTRVFNDTIVQLIIAIKAVNLEADRKSVV